MIITGIEDQDDWHGKPMADKAEAIINKLKETIKNNDPHGLVAEAPSDDVPTVQKSATLSSAPSYKDGEKVFHILTCICTEACFV